MPFSKGRGVACGLSRPVNNVPTASIVHHFASIVKPAGGRPTDPNTHTRPIDTIDMEETVMPYFATAGSLGWLARANTEPPGVRRAGSAG